MACASTAPAQVATATAQEDDAEASPDVVITGSRIGRAGFDTPTPTTITGGDTLLVGNRPSMTLRTTADREKLRVSHRLTKSSSCFRSIGRA